MSSKLVGIRAAVAAGVASLGERTRGQVVEHFAAQQATKGVNKNMLDIDFSKAFKEIAEAGSLALIGLCVVLFLYAIWEDKQINKEAERQRLAVDAIESFVIGNNTGD